MTFKPTGLTVQTFIETWNDIIPDYPLTIADLKSPTAILGVFMNMFRRLGIDVDAVLSPPTEENLNEYVMYYRDLIPLINITRVMNLLVADIRHCNLNINITHLLQPTESATCSMFWILLNLMLFRDEKTRFIRSLEEELVSKTEQMKEWKDKKNHIIEMINERAKEKGKRAERVEKLNLEIEQYEEELRQEKESYEKEKQNLEALSKESWQIDTIVEQKKNQLDTVLVEIEKKKALRVLDADDIKSQAAMALKNVQEVDEKLDSLRVTLMEKEKSLKNMQTIKPSLDVANNLLHKISKLSDSLREYSNGDLDMDSKDGELDVLSTELSDLEEQLKDLKATAASEAEMMARNRDQWQQEDAQLTSTIHEAEENLKIAKDRVQEIKENTLKYEKQETEGHKEITLIKQDFIDTRVAMAEALVKRSKEAAKKVLL